MMDKNKKFKGKLPNLDLKDSKMFGSVKHSSSLHQEGNVMERSAPNQSLSLVKHSSSLGKISPSVTNQDQEKDKEKEK